MITTDDVAEETLRGLFEEGRDHGIEYRSDGIEAFVCRTDIFETRVIEKDLLDDESSNGLGEFATNLHDPETEGDDLGLEEEVDDLCVIHLDEGTDDSETCETQVFEGPGC